MIHNLSIETIGGVADPKGLLADPDFKSKWIEGMTDDEYHADKTALGSSTIRIALMESLRAMYWAFFMGKKKPETPSMVRGRIIHMALLERQKFLERYRVMPSFTGRTLDGKESTRSKEAQDKKAKWLADLPPGSQVVSEDDLEMIENVAKSIGEDSYIMDVLRKSYVESIGYYRDPKTNLRLKIKPDFVAMDGSFIGDLKTTDSSDEFRWGKSFASFRYDFQLFMQAEGIFHIAGVRPKRYFLIMVQAKWPYESALVNIQIPTIENCRDEYNKVLGDIRKAVDSGVWAKKYNDVRQVLLTDDFINRQTREM
jgi:hypothetical protein